jgi:hypothetical protein
MRTEMRSSSRLSANITRAGMLERMKIPLCVKTSELDIDRKLAIVRLGPNSEMSKTEAAQSEARRDISQAFSSSRDLAFF